MANAPTQSAKKDQIVAQLTQYWTQAGQAKTDVDAIHCRVIESYNGILPKKVRQSKAVQTKTHLAWTAQAVDAFTNRLSPLLMPGPTKYMSLSDNSKAYSLAASVMQKMIGYFMTVARIDAIIDNITDTLALQGAIGLQPRWDYCYGQDKLPRFQIGVINPKDICVFPVTEPVERAVLMVRTYMTKAELLDMAETAPPDTFDIGAIKALEDKTVFSKPTTGRKDVYNTRLGLEVVDYYAPALRVDEEMFYHVRATVVSGKTLIRFISKDDQHSPTRAGAIFACLNELYIEDVGPVRVGVGLCNKAIDIEMSAITVHNLGIDSIKDEVKPPRTYDPTDKYWNKDRSAFVPGELVASTSMNVNHLKAIESSGNNIGRAEEMISRMMYQYQSAVGMPNFLSGTSDTDDRRVSATAKKLEANGADAGLRKHGKNINARAIQPLTETLYEMIEERITAEIKVLGDFGHQYVASGGQITPDLMEQWIATQPFLTQAKQVSEDFTDWLRSGQGIPPISALLLKLSTFEDAVQKVDQVNNVERVFGTLVPLAGSDPSVATVVAAQTDLGSLIRTYVTGLDLGDSLKPITQVEEAIKQGEQAKQSEQQKNEALQAAQMQMAADKAQADADKVKAEITKIEAETTKAAAETQKIQADTLQVIEETNNPKEPQSNGTANKTGAKTPKRKP